MRGRHALVAMVLPGVLLTAACNGSAGTTRSVDSTNPSTSESGPSGSTPSDPGSPGSSGSSETPVVADHAVDPPGPRKGALGLADVLVFNPDALSAETIASIRRIKGVQSVESLSLAQVPIENRLITVAAVDASTYRNYTPYASAETQDVWNRVAGGELAIRPDLKKKLPADQDGYLRLGSDKEAAQVHIGAFAAQVEGAIDAVVNESWIPTLKMQTGNALLITTGQTAPASLRKPIEQAAGPRASVQMLDVVAREGLDINAVQTAFLVGSVADAVGTFNYTVLGGGHIAPEPSWVSSHIATMQVPILGSVTCNRLVFPQLTAALNAIIDQGLEDKIHPSEYAGCYYPRFIAGTTSLSNHSFGLAFDINTPGNQRGTVGELDRGVVAIFKKWGFAWGGDWNYTDPMHFEMNALVNPR